MLDEIESYSIGPQTRDDCKAMHFLFLCGLFLGSEKKQEMGKHLLDYICHKTSFMALWTNPMYNMIWYTEYINQDMFVE